MGNYRKNENPFGSRDSVCLEEFRKLEGKFYESGGRRFESIQAEMDGAAHSNTGMFFGYLSGL